MRKMTKNEIIPEYRHEIMEKFNTTEHVVSLIISQHYFDDMNCEFISNLLYNYCMSSSARISILKDILKNRSIDVKSIRKLKDMNKIRNKFAHCNTMIEKDENNRYVFNPKDLSKEIDLDEEYKNFISYYNEVFPFLMDTYEAMGGTFGKNE